MIRLLRGIDRVLAVALLLVLAVLAGAAAVFCIQGGRATLSLTHLSVLLHITDLRAIVGEFLHDLEAPGPVAIVAVLSGIGAILVGLLLLVGLLVPRRERLVALEHAEGGGTIAARRRALARAAGALVDQVRGVSGSRVRVRPRRGRVGGRLNVVVRRAASVDEKAIKPPVEEALHALTEPFKLSERVKVRVGRDRVQ